MHRTSEAELRLFLLARPNTDAPRVCDVVLLTMSYLVYWEGNPAVPAYRNRSEEKLTVAARDVIFWFAKTLLGAKRFIGTNF